MRAPLSAERKYKNMKKEILVSVDRGETRVLVDTPPDLRAIGGTQRAACHYAVDQRETADV